MDQFKFKNKKLPYLLVLPQMVIVTVFVLYPTFESIRISFFTQTLFGEQLTFVGLSNYIDLVTNPDYVQTISVTLIFSAGVTILGLVVGMALSLLVNQKIGGLFFYRSSLIWLYALSPAVAGTIWMFLMHPSYGVINRMLPFDFNWILSGTHAMILVVVAAAWRMLGYNVAFFLAGLQGIPDSLLEAASLDGAGPLQRFRRVIFPLLTPTTFFLITMNLVYSFYRTFGIIHTVTKGGPSGSTRIMVYNVYRDGFINMRPGASSAQSVLLFIFVIIIILFQFKYLEGRVHYG